MWRVSSLAIWCMRSMKTRHLPAQWGSHPHLFGWRSQLFRNSLNRRGPGGGNGNGFPPPKYSWRVEDPTFLSEENQNGPSQQPYSHTHPTPTISSYILPSGKLTRQWKITLFEDVWTLLNMGIFQPAMLVYWRVLHKPQAKAGIGAGTSRFRALLFKASADWLGVAPCSLQRDAWRRTNWRYCVWWFRNHPAETPVDSLVVYIHPIIYIYMFLRSFTPSRY